MTSKVMGQEQDLGTYIQNPDLHRSPFQGPSWSYTECWSCL